MLTPLFLYVKDLVFMIFNFLFKIFYPKNIYNFFQILFIYFILFSTTDVLGKTYTVENIEITEPYNLSFDKEKVTDKAFISAFKVLKSRILISGDHKKAKISNLKNIKPMIDSFSIDDETFINNNYSARFDVIFNKKKIINYYNNQNIITSIPKKKNILFLPILIDLNKNELFIYKDNIFFEKWNNKINQNFLLNYLFLTEDLDDIKLIQDNLDNIENYNFKELLNKYNSTEYIVCIIFKDQTNVKILSKINLSQQLSVSSLTFNDVRLGDDNTIDDLIYKLKINYDDKWKIQNQINTAIKLNLTVSIKSDKLKKIKLFEKKLYNTDLVHNFEIFKISSFNTIYKIVYNGTPNKFINSFGKIFDLDISKEIWEIK